MAEKRIKETIDELEKDKSANWIDLANHFQAKVQKRTSEVSFLQTKAGFLIAAGALVLQIIIGVGKLDNIWGRGFLALSVLVALSSLILAIISMHISKSTTALNPEKMILALTERPTMNRADFGNWLSKSYAETNKRFNTEYSKKYRQQLIAAILLVIAFILILVAKGIKDYV